jgi:hypothetical protein
MRGACTVAPPEVIEADLAGDLDPLIGQLARHAGDRAVDEEARQRLALERQPRRALKLADDVLAQPLRQLGRRVRLGADAADLDVQGAARRRAAAMRLRLGRLQLGDRLVRLVAHERRAIRATRAIERHHRARRADVAEHLRRQPAHGLVVVAERAQQRRHRARVAQFAEHDHRLQAHAPARIVGQRTAKIVDAIGARRSARQRHQHEHSDGNSTAMQRRHVSSIRWDPALFRQGEQMEPT